MRSSSRYAWRGATRVWSEMRDARQSAATDGMREGVEYAGQAEGVAVAVARAVYVRNVAKRNTHEAPGLPAIDTPSPSIPT